MPGFFRSRPTASRLMRLSPLLIAPIAAALLVPGWLGAGAGRPDDGFRSRSRLPEIRRGEVALEIRLEDYVEGFAADGSIRIDRAALEASLHGLLGRTDPIESILLMDLVDAAPRVRITWRAMSAEVARPTIVFLARRIVGRDAPIGEITVGDMLGALSNVTLDRGGTPSIAGQPGLFDELGRTLGRAERSGRAADPALLERFAQEDDYLLVSDMVRQIRRSGPLTEDEIYDEAFNRLVAADRADAVALLDGHRLLEAELATADSGSMSLAERIGFRAEARRRAFGDAQAELLFGRQEAMERYQIDLLAIQADGALTGDDRAARIAGRRSQLQVELAAQGSWVGFVGQDRERVDEELRIRYGDRFERMSEAERAEARRRVYLERLDAAQRADVEHLRGKGEGAKGGSRGGAR